MRILLISIVLFFSNTLYAADYPPVFARYDHPDIVTQYRQFSYEPQGFDSILNDGKVDTVVTYNKNTVPRYVLISMPGGDGLLHLELNADRTIKSFWGYNTYTRMRKLFAQNEYYVVTMDATDNANRIMAVVNSVQREYPNIPVYVVGISRSTRQTISLSKSLDGRIAGFVHTSSMADTVYSLRDNERNRSRNLLIHNTGDACNGTPFSTVKYASESKGLTLVSIAGGEEADKTQCGPFTLHGFYQTEDQLFAAVNNWVRQ